MKSMRYLLALLLSLGGTSHAQVLNRCMAGSGAVSWQSTSCDRGSRQVRSIAYTPDVPTAALTTTPRSVKADRKSGSSRRSSYRVSARQVQSRRDPCTKAKDHREATLERVGLKRTYDLLSRLDADVRRVCR